ncbi:MAG: hypothetical protein HY707_08830 [Ignavibacteriae bacterium]|nr:hypothetical protein [Ignavibacteriota bacterium]
MTRLLDDVFSKGFETLRLLISHSDFTVKLGDAIRAKGGVDRALCALHQEFFPTEVIAPVQPDVDKNPYELPVEVKLAALRRANDEGGWGIPIENINYLAETVPALPKGRFVFLSFRIRFGEGDEGVALTFERHAKRIKEVFGEKFWRWDYLLSGKHPHKGKPVERLRLLLGNHTHKPTVEWCVIDLDANRQRESIMAVRGPQSLADELFVFTWLFPDYIRSINYEENPAIFAAGYELNVPESVDEPWQRVPCVDRNLDDGTTYLDAYWRSDDYSGYSVPLLRE